MAIIGEPQVSIPRPMTPSRTTTRFGDGSPADPRVLVRRHAAYGLARIEAHAPASPIKDLATELGERLDAEPYLTISNYRRLALAEPAYFPPLLARIADAPMGTEQLPPSPSDGPDEG